MTKSWVPLVKHMWGSKESIGMWLDAHEAGPGGDSWVGRCGAPSNLATLPDVHEEEDRW
jgi:hypothetical protein